MKNNSQKKTKIRANDASPALAPSKATSASKASAENDTNKEKPRTRLGLILIAVAVLIIVIAFAGKWSLTAYAKAIAKNHISQFQYADALSWITFAENLNVADSELYFLKARIYRKTGKFELFDSAIAKSRELGLPEQTMINERLLLQGQSGYLSGLMNNLEQMAGGVNQFDPTEIYEAAVNGYIRVGRFSEAADFLYRWEKDFPNDPNQKFLKATLLMEFGNLASDDGDPIQLLQSVTTQYPSHYQAIMALGDAFLRSNRETEALATFKLCENVEPVQTNARLKIAGCLARLGQQNDAKKYYEAILEADPQNIEAQAELGKIQFNDQQYEKALVNLESAYARRDWDFDLANSLARVLQLFDREKEAEALFEKSQGIRDKLSGIQDLKFKVDTGSSTQDRVQLAKLLLEYGDPNVGKHYLQSALDMDPENAQARQIWTEYFGKPLVKNPSFRSPQGSPR